MRRAGGHQRATERFTTVSGPRGVRRAGSAAGSLGLLALLALLATCADDGDESVKQPTLVVSSPMPVDALRVVVVGEQGGERVVIAPELPGGEALLATGLRDRDLGAKPYRVALRFPSAYPDALVVHVQGWRDDRLIGIWAGAVERDRAIAIPAPLEPVLAGCDADGDGYPDCALTGCCPVGLEGHVGDCDDTLAEANPGAIALPACVPCATPPVDWFCDGSPAPCVDSSGDGCADCSEALGHCELPDPSCDPLVGAPFDPIGAGCAPAPPPCYGWGPQCSDTGQLEGCLLTPQAPGSACVAEGGDACASGPGTCEATPGGPTRCVPSASCSELLPCERLTCQGDACEVTVRPGWCRIEGACLPEGQPDPADPCSVCDPASNAEAFTALPDGGECRAGDPCFHAGVCEAGVCADSVQIDCDDGVACTLDLCQPGVGCVNTPLDAECQDGDPCTTGACDATSGCSFPPLTGPLCDDGEVCTEGDTCQAGACVGQPVVCDDGDPCTAGACVPGQGCAFSPLSGPACDDGDPCTEATACQEGLCAGGAPTECDDGNPCTEGACTPAEGCTFSPLDGPACDDGNICTELTTCQAGQCAGGTSVGCDDGVACTVDYCDAIGGCLNVPIDPACNDGDACTVDTCDPAVGCVYEAVICDDGIDCTTDLCDPAQGCGSIPNNAACDDGDACTDDVCAPKIGCQHPPVVCDDGVACTVDTCDPATGCAHEPTDALCTETGACGVGTCDAQNGCGYDEDNSKCDDSNPCTTDLCGFNSGQGFFCANLPVTCPPGQVCDPADGGCVDP